MGKLQSSAVHFLLLSPLYAAYGAWVIVRSLLKLVRWAMWTARLVRPALRCSACGKSTQIHGRWRCQSPGCGAVYLGAADRCGRCGSGAGMIDCVHCGASISLRPARW